MENAALSPMGTVAAVVPAASSFAVNGTAEPRHDSLGGACSSGGADGSSGDGSNAGSNNGSGSSGSDSSVGGGTAHEAGSAGSRGLSFGLVSAYRTGSECQ